MSENTKPKIQENYSNPMGYAPILPLIIKMSLPSIFSMVIQALYNIVDSIYVAQISEDALSAVSLIYPVQLLNAAVAVGTGVGLSSFISRRLGEKQIEEAENGINHGIIISNIEWLIFLLFGIFGSRAFCEVFSESESLIVPGTVYCRIICIGSVFIFNAVAGERAMQACGNMMFPMICQLAGSVTNIILDPIMIFGKLGLPAMGVAGAAYATVIGQFFAMCATYIFLYRGNFPIKIKLRTFRFRKQTVRDIFAVALPAMIMQSISSITTMCINRILINFSATAVAVNGCYHKLQSFAFMPMFGLNQGVMPIMGYNYGAKNKKRLIDALKLSVIICFSFMTIVTILCQLIPDLFMGLFNPSEDMMALGVKALKTISWCFPFAVLAIVPGAMFQATGHGTISMFNSILRQIVVIIPAAYLLSLRLGTDGVWLAYPIAECMSLLFTSVMFIRLYNKEIRYL